jgi:hypothetical protein
MVRTQRDWVFTLSRTVASCAQVHRLALHRNHFRRGACPARLGERLTDFTSGSDKIQMASTDLGRTVGTLAASRFVQAGMALTSTPGS